ncbi:phytosulfokines 3 [Raphanus sativus]|uniref:Phytosulfokine n=1 Tax=Raphanus sativus TaxID=3726 RepID=A0A6J0JP89_RAPSA|nr:phytosulfokines 3 [Raphanus sativus]
MAKFTTIFIMALLLCSTLTYAARLTPTTTTFSSREDSVKETEGDKAEEESCEGIEEDECLIRRTLVAHTDYIYTQNHKH